MSEREPPAEPERASAGMRCDGTPKHDGHTPPYTPTPDQIREACAEIQAEWDEETELKRRVTKLKEPFVTRARARFR